MIELLNFFVQIFFETLYYRDFKREALKICP